VTKPSWGDWALRHRALFGLNTPEEIDMITEWAALFALEGLMPDELLQASEWLLLAPGAPRFRTEQPAALVARVRHNRKQLERSPPPPADDPHGTCSLCDSTGLVTVPCRRLDRHTGEWRMPGPPGWFGTMAVTCTCALGRWKRERTRLKLMIAGTVIYEDRRPMGLDEYEVLTPDWRQELARHAEWQRRQVRVTARSQALDEALGEIRKRQRQAKANDH